MWTRCLGLLRRNSRLNGCIKMSLSPLHWFIEASALVGTAAIMIGSRLDAGFFCDPVTTRVMKMYECDEAVTHRGTDLSRLPWEIMKRGSPAAHRRLFVAITRPSTIARNTGFGFQIAYYHYQESILSDCNYSNYHNIFFNRDH